MMNGWGGTVPSDATSEGSAACGSQLVGGDRSFPGGWKVTLRSVAESAAHLSRIYVGLARSAEFLGAWIALTPKLEHKIAWAYHLFDDVVLAHEVGQRIFRLTGEWPAQLSTPWLNEVARLTEAPEQIDALYQKWKPGLLDLVTAYRTDTHAVADEPSIRILLHAEERLRIHVNWGAEQETRPFQSKADRWSLVTEYARPVLIDLPARDDRFAAGRMPKPRPIETQEGRVRLLHIALINLEIPAIEVCARILGEFPEAPWDLKLDMANQIWDEARHAVMCRDRLLELGGQIGQFPYHHKVWEQAMEGTLTMSAAESADPAARLRRLAERFVTTQRIHEGNGLDQTLLARETMLRVGDPVTAQIMDFICADEVNHVRYGNRWIEELTGGGEARDRLIKQVEERLGPAALAGPPLVNEPGRLSGGFLRPEVDAIKAFRARKGNPQ